MKKIDVIKVKPDPKYYGIIDDLDDRFSNGIPSLMDCDSLTINGDVGLEEDVTVKSSVRMKNRQKSRGIIKAETILE
jgi:UTP--glucose-1-phosphate uridylyltransferase